MAALSHGPGGAALSDPHAHADVAGQQARLRRTVGVVLGLFLLFLIVWRWPIGSPFAGAAQYVPLHIGLETASIVAAMLVFGITWDGYARDRAGNVVILGTALLVAALIDFVHLLSFAGMPDLVTPSGHEKAINFWLCARLVVALAFLVAAVRPWQPLKHSRSRHLILGTGLAITVLVVWAGLYEPSWWPRTFIVGQGLTTFKVAAEYAIDAVMAVPLVLFYVRARRGHQAYDATSLFAAVAISMQSELAFTLYSDVTDIFNLLGHVYKIIAYLYLYRAMFVASVHQPIERAVRAEEETQRATRWTAELLANLPTAVVVHAADSRVRYGNPAALKFLGLTEGQLLGRAAMDPDWQFLREDGSPMPLEEYPVMQVLATGEAVQGAVVGVRRRQGAEPSWGWATGFPEVDPQGAIREVVVSFTDVTERIRGDRALRRSEEAYRSLVTAMAEGVVVQDADGRITAANPAAERIERRPAAEMVGGPIGEAWQHAVHGDGSPFAVDLQPATLALRTGEPQSDVVMGLPRADGSHVWLSVNAQPLRSDGAHPSAVVTTFHDITQQREAAESMAHLNRELRAISLCNEALIRAEDEDTLLREICRIVNEEAGYRLAWVGMVEHDAAKSVRPVASAGDDDGYLAAAITWEDVSRGQGPCGTAIRTRRTASIRDFGSDHAGAPWRDAALAHGYRSNISLPLLAQDGEVFGVLSIYSELPDAFTPEERRLLEELAGDLAFGISVLRTRESQAVLEAQLRQAQKMEVVGQLAGGIAHDFNNLLAAIRGYGELLRGELPPEDERSRRDLEEVLDAAARAELLTRQLLAFARRQVLVPVVLRPGEILSALAPMLGRVLGEQVELTVTVDPQAGRVRVDPGQLEQVILNLAINARDAMPGGGPLTIEVTRVDASDTEARTGSQEAAPGGYVLLTVADAGVGMDEATQAHLFEPFFTTKPEGRGTGLGLATVYGIVRQSGGHISIESALGVGTTVRVFLPRTVEEAHAVPETGAPPGPAPRGSETVLLVEDDAAVRGFASRVLRSLGYRVLEAGAGADALGLAAAHDGPIDALVTDIVMPGMAGTSLATRLAEARPGLCVLYMSGYSSGALGPDLPSDVAFLGKPFSSEALGRALRAALDRVEAAAG